MRLKNSQYESRVGRGLHMTTMTSGFESCTAAPLKSGDPAASLYMIAAFGPHQEMVMWGYSEGTSATGHRPDPGRGNLRLMCREHIDG
ncbi:hypothetical protein [Nocardia gamkensis]|uniref:hypothetical protein n=1 Tax=Nocardia gamkensis TaxID=352869 RepID=UPI0037CC2AF5